MKGADFKVKENINQIKSIKLSIIKLSNNKKSQIQNQVKNILKRMSLSMKIIMLFSRQNRNNLNK